MSDKPATSHITKGTRVSVALRTVMLEACWNNKGKQNLGFCFSILPALRRLYSGEVLNGAIKSSLSVFNTNPCFSGFVAGAVIEQEAHSRTDESQHQAGIDRMKSMLGGTFGALGDDLMWFSLKPFLGTLAVLLFLLGHEWAFIWMVGIFSISNIALRFKGVELGLKGVLAIQQFLQKIKPNCIAAELKRATCVLLGAVVGVLLSAPHEHSAQGAGPWFGAAIILPVVAACFLLRSRNVSSDKIGIGICALVLIGVLLS